MGNYRKVYVTMFLRVDREGHATPVRLEWEDGRIYPIDRVISERMSPPEHVGAIATRRYDVVVSGRKRTVYLETYENRWFVEQPISL